MLFSKTCDYAIRASLYVASQTDRSLVPIREISDKLDISFHFLTKILQKLTLNGILTSWKGPKGGVQLNADPKDISLKSIIMAVDGPDFFRGCVLGLDNCDGSNPCPIHDEWQPLRTQLLGFFETTTLDVFESKLKTNHFKMTPLKIDNN